MRLKKIILHNIRSYKNEEINFPEGSLLLSGEAGSGKSSILLAIEFALFGIGKGRETLSADALMRRGEEESSVRLFFTLNNQEIEIQRNLKRKVDKVQQLSGHIKIDDQLEKLSPDELKTRVLQLFNYPFEFVKKGKGLPFHYTVYTQQEQMKSILLEGVDLRLNTLRRVFGIDRYKIIQENSEIFLTALKEKIKEKEGAILDLPERHNQYKTQEAEKQGQLKELQKLLPELEKEKAELNARKSELDELEKKIQEARSKKEQLSAKNAETKSNRERIERETKEIRQLEGEIIKLEELAKKFNPQELTEITSKIKELRELIKKNEEEIRGLIQAQSKVEAKKDSALILKNKIQKVDICPECNQKVTEEHKREIEERAAKEIIESNEKIKEIRALIERKEKEKTEMEQRQNQAESKEEELRELKVKADSLKEKIERKQKLENEKSNLEKRIEQLEKETVILQAAIEKTINTENYYQKKREEFELIREKEKDLEIKKAGHEKLIESITRQLKLLEEEINKKEKFKQHMQSLKELREFISLNFTEIILKIEQSVLATLHSQFDSLLKKWFAMLIEEPEISIRLDIDFSPIVEQAGFDTDYSHLSGGERTAVALAYRLALNQVINSLISQIKTRDLLILDEPTEGFSYLQLDKMRNVLAELNLKQLIIISHNPKIEGFVDNVIRIQKEGHISRVL